MKEDYNLWLFSAVLTALSVCYIFAYFSFVEKIENWERILFVVSEVVFLLFASLWSSSIHYKKFNIEKIITSPLLRARQTASIVNEELKTDIEVSYNIIEWSGPYEWIGNTIEEIKLTDSFKNYNNNPLNLKNTLESLKNVHDRFKLDYEKYENTLFVSHQDTIRAFTYYYLEEKDFTKNRPVHCELQSIENKIINTY